MRCDDAPVVRALRDVPLVGRERELAVLREGVDNAAAGVPAAVLVAGEAGIGKTRLVRELLRVVRPAAVVLRAQCVDLGEPGLPYLTLVDLVRALRDVSEDDAEVAAVLERHPAVRELTEPSPAGDPTDLSRRHQQFDAAAAALGEVARLRGPVVVVIEDLQWLDSSSAAFLRFLLSRLDDERLAVVMTLRSHGLASRSHLRQLLSEIGRLPGVDRLDLEPLDEAQVGELLSHLDPTGDDSRAAELYRRTHGNPYYVETLATAGDSAADEGATPRALADLLTGRLDGLPDDVRAVVRAASVVPRAVPDRLLRRVVGLSDHAADAALRAAVAEGLLRSEGDGYAFLHDLLRGAVHDDLLPGERARLHSAFAAALQTGAGGRFSAVEVAHHVTEAHDAPQVVAWSVRAADEATGVLAPHEALQHLERALAEWPGVEDAAALAEATYGQVALRAALAAGLAGESSRAISWARRAIELCDADGDAVGGVQARAELVRQLVAADATDRVIAPAEEAVRLAESAEVDPVNKALAHVMLARALLSTRQLSRARSASDAALSAASTAGAPGLEVEALTTAAFLDEIEGDRSGAADRLANAIRRARADGELAAELRAHYALASLHYYNGDVRGSLPMLQAAMVRVDETGVRWSASGVQLRLLHVVALYVAGQLDASLEATYAAKGEPPDAAAAMLAAVSCHAAVARGLPDAEARLAALDGSWDADPLVALMAGGCEAERLAWAGSPLAAVAAVERAQTHLDAVAGEGMYGGIWLSAVALAALADEATSCRQRRDDTGEGAALEAGIALMDRVARIVDGGHGRPGDLGPEGRAWHARAVAEHARLRDEPGVAEWQLALEAFGYGHAYEEARCHWRLAEALVAAGDRDAAKQHAQVAATAAEGMRAEPLRSAVAATITRFRLGASAASADAVLTAREQEILALVAEGLTNREIGKRLFISDKTASVHLSNVMAKLNASSRTEAVTVAQRRGLLELLAPGQAPGSGRTG